MSSPRIPGGRWRWRALGEKWGQAAHGDAMHMWASRIINETRATMTHRRRKYWEPRSSRPRPVSESLSPQSARPCTLALIDLVVLPRTETNSATIYHCRILSSISQYPRILSIFSLPAEKHRRTTLGSLQSTGFHITHPPRCSTFLDTRSIFSPRFQKTSKSI